MSTDYWGEREGDEKMEWLKERVGEIYKKSREKLSERERELQKREKEERWRKLGI